MSEWTGALIESCQIEAPEAIFIQAKDSYLGLSRYAVERHDGRFWYFPRDLRPTGLRKDFECKDAAARAHEITDAFDAWQSAQDLANAKAGVNRAIENEIAVDARLSEIETKIERHNAHTVEGLLIKVKLIQSKYSKCDEDQLVGLIQNMTSIADSSKTYLLPLGNHVSPVALSD